MPGSVDSKQVLVFSSLLSAVTLAWALYVLCVEIFCRDYKHIENVMYQSYSEESETRPGRGDIESVRLSVGRRAMLVFPVLILVAILPGRRLVADRALLEVICAFVGETLDEAAGTRYLFTDGSYDAALRIEA